MKAVLITGASAGIGEEFARQLAVQGNNLVLAARRLDRLETLASELRQRHNLEVVCIASDLALAGAAEKLVADMATHNVELTGLINNAGWALRGSVEDTAPDEWDKEISVNLRGHFLCAKAVLPGMVRQGRGTIVNISSVEGRIGTPFSGGYAASKFALEGLSESLRVGLWPLRVRVFLVEQGDFPTGLQSNQVIAERADFRDLS